MREIKFRAWDKVSRSMHNKGFAIGPHASIDWSEYYWVKKPDLILMQYTGLKDKNGVEIYEGDIVKGVAGFYPISWSKNLLQWDAGSLMLWAFDNPEVVGNIYENPELLESRKEQDGE